MIDVGRSIDIVELSAWGRRTFSPTKKVIPGTKKTHRVSI